MRSTKSKVTTEQAAEILLSAQSVALFSHVRPDGDTVGAASALCLALRKAGKNVALFCSDELSDGLKKFPLSLQYSQTFFGKYDLMVAVDCGDVFRLGDFSGVYDANPGPGQRDRLIEPLPARIGVTVTGGQRFSRPHQMRHPEHLIQIQRTEVHDLCSRTHGTFFLSFLNDNSNFPVKNSADFPGLQEECQEKKAVHYQFGNDGAIL